jgi:hypothetical protein
VIACQSIPSHPFDLRPILTEVFRRFFLRRELCLHAAGLSQVSVRNAEKDSQALRTAASIRPFLIDRTFSSISPCEKVGTISLSEARRMACCANAGVPRGLHQAKAQARAQAKGYRRDLYRRCGMAIHFEDREPLFDDEIQLRRFTARIARLNLFFGRKKLGEMSTKLTNSYVTKRGGPGGARRTLKIFEQRSTITRLKISTMPSSKITLPEKGEARDRWLERSEAASLILAAWRYKEEQTIHRGKNKGIRIKTGKYTLRHVARFILIGLYTVGFGGWAVRGWRWWRNSARSYRRGLSGGTAASKIFS